MLSTILSISGKPGLYRLISQGRNNLIVESLVDGRRLPVLARERVISLGDISMYTDSEDIALSEVLTKTYECYAGQAVDLAKLTSPTELQEAFGAVLPSFDRERVYTSDIKKLFTWYNILIAAGFTTFADEVPQEEA